MDKEGKRLLRKLKHSTSDRDWKKAFKYINRSSKFSDLMGRMEFLQEMYKINPMKYSQLTARNTDQKISLLNTMETFDNPLIQWFADEKKHLFDIAYGTEENKDKKYEGKDKPLTTHGDAYGAFIPDAKTGLHQGFLPGEYVKNIAGHELGHAFSNHGRQILSEIDQRYLDVLLSGQPLFSDTSKDALKGHYKMPVDNKALMEKKADLVSKFIDLGVPLDVINAGIKGGIYGRP